MMSKEEIKIQKKVYERNSVSNVISREFNQLIQKEQEVEIQPIPTIEDFFALYDELFFEIPKEGEKSHQELITRSSEYLGIKNENSIDVQLLQEEITLLRQQLLESNQALENIKISGAKI